MRARLTCLDDSRLPDAQKGLVLELDKPETSIGRGSENTEVISHSSISRNHALIVSTDEGLIIRDLNSTNGVWLNGERTAEARLGNGDTVAFGSLMFRFETMGESAEEPESETKPSQAQEENQDQPSLIAESSGVPEEEAKPEHAEEPAPAPVDHIYEDDSDEDVADKTMLYGDSRASEAILDAMTHDVEEAEEPAPLPPRHHQPEPETEPREVDEKPKEQRNRQYVGIAAVIILGLLTWWVIEARQTAAEERLVQTYTNQINEFVEQYELWTRRFNPEQTREQLAELDQISTDLTNNIRLRPTLDSLKPLLVEVDFLKLERETRQRLAENSPEDALELVDAVRGSAQSFVTEDISADVRQALLHFISLADLLDTIARYKIFQKKFPDPSRYTDIHIPDALRREISSAKKLKVRFATLLKENNMPLKVRFRLARGMAGDTDENCVLLVNRWYHRAFGEKPGSG